MVTRTGSSTRRQLQPPSRVRRSRRRTSHRLSPRAQSGAQRRIGCVAPAAGAQLPAVRGEHACRRDRRRAPSPARPGIGNTGSAPLIVTSSSSRSSRPTQLSRCSSIDRGIRRIPLFLAAPGVLADLRSGRSRGVRRPRGRVVASSSDQPPARTGYPNGLRSRVSSQLRAHEEWLRGLHLSTAANRMQMDG